jgi:hypothetical protein
MFGSVFGRLWGSMFGSMSGSGFVIRHLFHL